MSRRPKSRYRHNTREKAEAIRRRYFAREVKQAELALEYNLSQATISRIVSGHIWT